MSFFLVFHLDAAGRPDKWRPKAKKDHSCADRLVKIDFSHVFIGPIDFDLVRSEYWRSIFYT